MLIGAKKSHGEKLWFVWDFDNDQKVIRQFPDARMPSDFYEALREWFGMSSGASRRDIKDESRCLRLKADGTLERMTK